MIKVKTMKFDDLLLLAQTRAALQAAGFTVTASPNHFMSFDVFANDPVESEK